jgi:trehalose synthase
VPLLRELGIQTSWDVIKGGEAFNSVSRAFYGALRGTPNAITDEMFEIFRANTAMNIRETALTGDIVMVHDPEPLGLIDQSGAGGHQWIWHCHIDVSKADPRVWRFLSDYADRYDASIFSTPDFAPPLPIPRYVVMPSIDPLSDKNKELSPEEIDRVLQKYGLDPERPILTQISRFNSLNDPLGVINAYRLVKRRHNCQLILAASGSTGDTGGAKVLADARERAADDPDIHVLALPPFSDVEVNALVRGSTIVFQKSVREGFSLSVSEALWKRKPVVGGAVGGIKLQVIDGATGFLVHSPEGAATRAMQLLADPELRRQMGAKGHEHVRRNFLLTRHVKDYLLAMLSLLHPEEDLVNL